ncbi:hypothetical protein AB4097_17650 [Microvirga sp. 2MCAF35]|uniref:hypothetical protein n=1 Tax=Microvirga sp. 2MCAF35 TaxID=3232987 RepID=UPI003F9989E9
MEDIFARLAEEASMVDASAEAEANTCLETSSFPPTNAITLMTFNYYDNGPGGKPKWSASRYAMNVQVFTLDTPFTPSSKLAAWEGTVQMHDPDFFDNYTDHYWSEHSDCITADQIALYKAVIAETAAMPKVEEGPLLGQFWSKSPGWEYHWGSLIRVHYNAFGEFVCEVFHDGETYLIDTFASVPRESGKSLPIMRGRHDPGKLWRKAPPKPSKKGSR